MVSADAWSPVAEAIRFAAGCIDFDPDPLNVGAYTGAPSGIAARRALKSALA